MANNPPQKHGIANKQKKPRAMASQGLAFPARERHRSGLDRRADEPGQHVCECHVIRITGSFS